METIKLNEPFKKQAAHQPPSPFPFSLSLWEKGGIVVQVMALWIPSIGIALTVFTGNAQLWDNAQWDLLEEQAQEYMVQGAFKYPYHDLISAHSSPPPRYQGNYGTAFQRLPELKPRSLIIFNKTRYRVTQTLIVKPTDTWIIDEFKNSLVLVTCWPIGTTKERFVVVADTY